eukprot:3264506-Pyramimonas_sp.AAC.1
MAQLKEKERKVAVSSALIGAEIPLVLFNVFVFGIPQQAYVGLSVLLIKNIPGYVMVVGGMLVIVYFVKRIQG